MFAFALMWSVILPVACPLESVVQAGTGRMGWMILGYQIISKDYVPHLHDCDDMAQEFRDWLFDLRLADKDSLRFAVAEYWKDGKLVTGHMWVETGVTETKKVRMGRSTLFTKQTTWSVFDLTHKTFGVPTTEALQYKRYKVVGYLQGETVFRDGQHGGGQRWVVRGQPWNRFRQVGKEWGYRWRGDRWVPRLFIDGREVGGYWRRAR